MTGWRLLLVLPLVVSNNSAIVNGGPTTEEVTTQSDTTTKAGPMMVGMWSKRTLWTFVTLYSLVILLNVVGNATLVAVIIKNKNLFRSSSNLFLLSLVTARAFIGIFVVPARITGMFSELYLGSILCKLCHWAANGSNVSSVLSIVCIAILKYRQIVHGNIDTFTLRKSAMMIGLVWLIGFTYAIRAPVMNDLILVEKNGMSMYSCTVDKDYAYTNKFMIFADLCFLFLMPFAIVIVCYTKVIKELTRIRNMENKVSIIQENSKAIRMLVILTSLFTICTLCPMIPRMYVMWGGPYFEDISILENVIYLFSYSNSWFNLIVFCVFRDDIRDGFKNMFCSGKSNKVGNKTCPDDKELTPEGDNTRRLAAIEL